MVHIGSQCHYPPPEDPRNILVSVWCKKAWL